MHVTLCLVIFVSFGFVSAQREVCKTKTQADIVFIMDGSGSIGGQNFLTQLDFIKYIINQFPVGPDDVQFGLLQFSTLTKVEFKLNTYKDKQSILNKLGLIPYSGGGTKIGLALTEAKAKMFTSAAGRRAGVPTVAIVITDGRSTDSVVQPAYDLRSDYIQVFAIGIGSQANIPELTEIASFPKDQHRFMVNNFNGLQNIQQSLVKIYCEITTQAPTSTPEATRPTGITFTDAPTTTPAVTKPPITKPPVTRPPVTRPPVTRPPVTRPPVTKPPVTKPPVTRPPVTKPPVTKPPVTRPPVTRPPSEPSKPGPTRPPTFPTDAGTTTLNFKIDCADDKADIAFALDSSGSISLSDWRVLKQFVKQMVQSFNLGRDKTRVAAIRFSDHVTSQFELKDSFFINTLNEIQKMQYDGAGTKTDKALRYLQQVSFTAQNGARQGVSKIAIIITDGNSNNPAETQKVADELKQQGVLIFAIGVGDKVTPDELRRMASDPKDDFVFTVSSYKDLSKIQARLNTKTCGKVKEFVSRPVSSGPTTAAPYCVDKSPSCNSLGGRDFCTDFEPWARLNCNATCKFCEGATTPTPGPCTDLIDDCYAYGAAVCTDPKFREFAETKCACSCKFCACQQKTTKPVQTAAVCRDEANNCRLYGRDICDNSVYATWVGINCRQFCGLCTGGGVTREPCVDKESRCADYGDSLCVDPAYKPWVEINCRKYCKVC